jgi:hypothetical protein
MYAVILRQLLSIFISPILFRIMEENKDFIKILTLKKYAGNPWLTSNTILLLFILISYPVLLWSRVYEDPVPAGTVTALIVAMHYMNTHIQMNYFVIKDNFLIIKNHYSFREQTIFPFHEISSFEIIKPRKLSISLKVFTTNGKSQVFFAGSLNKKNWEEFKKDMIGKGFHVKDEGNHFF